jgi:hypothetical protein
VIKVKGAGDGTLNGATRLCAYRCFFLTSWMDRKIVGMILSQIAICDGLFIMGLGDRLLRFAPRLATAVTAHLFSEVCL